MKLVKDISFLIIAGIILGIVITFSAGGIFLSLLIFLSGFLIWKCSKEEDRKFLTYIFISGIAIRMIIYLSYTDISLLFGKGGWFGGDAYGIYNYAWLYVQKLEGSRRFLINSLDNGMAYDMSQDFYNYYGGSYEKLINSFHYGNYGFHGFTMLLAYLFYIFGPIKFSGRLINILFGALSGIFIYYLVKRIYGQKSAKIAAVLVTFFPSMFIWSLDFFKDPLYILFSIVAFWSFIMYWDTKKILYIILIFIAVIIQSTIREDLWLIGLIPFTLGFFLVLKPTAIKKIVFISIIGIMLIFFIHNRGSIYTYISNKIALALQIHVGNVNTSDLSGGYAYRILDDRYYIPVNYSVNNITLYEGLGAFLKGWWHFLFQPFIWSIKSKSMLMAFPQMVLWYMLLMFAFVGIIFGLRYKWKYAIVMVSYLFLVSSIIALSSGNIGTLFRHRDMITPFYLIFSAVGIRHLLKIPRETKF
ncbi:MAG: glycosyltransferase family 39 protein [Candidatus Omnitrophota bacterium]